MHACIEPKRDINTISEQQYRWVKFTEIIIIIVLNDSIKSMSFIFLSLKTFKTFSNLSERI